MRLIRWCICCSIFILILAQLKPIEENEEENQYLLDLVSIVDDFATIQNFVTFTGNSSLGKQFNIPKSLEQRLMESFTRPVIVLGSTMENFMYLRNDRNIAIIYFRDFRDAIFNTVSHALSGTKIAGFIFICKPLDNSVLLETDMELFFTWCWEKKIKFSLLVLKRNNKFEVLAYEMKPKFRIFKFVESVKSSKEGCRHLSNMRQYIYAVAVFERIPDTIVLNSPKQHDLTGNKRRLGGQTGYFIAAFMRFVNGTSEILFLSEVDYYNVTTHDMTYKGRTIDIGATMISNTSLSYYSPAIKRTRTCLVLPYESHTSDYNALILYYKWSFITFTTFYFIVHMLIRRFKTPRMSISHLLFWNLRLLLLQPMDERQFQRLDLPAKIIEISTQMYNVLIISIYCGFVTMTLNLGLQKSKILDVKSFLATDLQIMVYGKAMPSYFEMNRLPMALTDRFLYVDERTRTEHLFALNDSFAYVITGKTWTQLKFMQMRLRNPKLRLAPDSLCGIESYQRLPLGNVNSTNFRLQRFVRYVQATGLPNRWMMLGLQQAHRLGMIVQAPYEPNVLRPLEMKFLANGFTLLILGFLLSSTVLVMELVYARITRKYRNTGVVA